jgi:hypothetical protein
MEYMKGPTPVGAKRSSESSAESMQMNGRTRMGPVSGKIGAVNNGLAKARPSSDPDSIVLGPAGGYSQAGQGCYYRLSNDHTIVFSVFEFFRKMTFQTITPERGDRK